MFCRRTLVCCLLLSPLWVAAASPDAHWPSWRGPQGDGHSEERELPIIWGDSQIDWKVELPGQGQSSPTIWGDRIFLTSSLEGGRQRMLICVDRQSRKIAWKEIAWTGEPEATHNMNPRASATCATDGEIVAAFFGKGGLHAYDLEGKKLWSRDLGAFEGPWGTASSPIIVGDVVIQNCDADDQAFLIAVDKKTGKTVWKTDRPMVVRGWSTPILVETGDRRQLVLNGHTGVTSYDPATGKQLWFLQGDRGRGTPTVTPYKDKLIAVSGRPGAMFAMQRDGKEVWRTARRGGRDLPSPIVVGDYLVVVSLQPGMASCYNAATGEELDRIRLNGKFSASPIAAAGLVYIPNEDGATYVLKPGEKLKVIANNSITCKEDEIFRASLTPCEGKLFLRSTNVLYCLKK